MADRADDAYGERPRPRPSATGSDGPSSVGSRPSRSSARRGTSTKRTRRPTGLARLEPAPAGQVVAAAGNALVTAGRMGRLLSRSSWRIARQLPGLAVVESTAQRVGMLAAAELNRMLQLPAQVVASVPTEELRMMTLVQDAHTDPAPLRTAMTELLDRSALADGERSREYLFGTIVSQLVPDEARMLAALATGRSFAVVDVLAREGGRSGRTRPVLANASTLGAAAGVAIPQSTPTYLTRLLAFGLVEFTAPEGDLDAQFETLRSDPAVREARDDADRSKQSSAKVARKAVRLSPLGVEFWQACAPHQSNAAPTPRSS